MQRRASGIQVHAGGALHNGTVGPQGVGRVGAAGESAAFADAKLGGTRKPPQLPKRRPAPKGTESRMGRNAFPGHSGGSVSSSSRHNNPTKGHRGQPRSEH